VRRYRQTVEQILERLSVIKSSWRDNHADRVIAALKALGILTSLRITVNTPVTWRDLLAERLKGGRGSAIKGQARGRYLEDFTERIVAKVFHDVGYEARCRFTGARGTSTEKADFAIPARNDARLGSDLAQLRRDHNL